MAEGEGVKEGSSLPSNADFQERLERLEEKEAAQAKKKVRQYPLPAHVEEALDVAEKRADRYGDEDLADTVRRHTEEPKAEK